MKVERKKIRKITKWIAYSFGVYTSLVGILTVPDSYRAYKNPVVSESKENLEGHLSARNIVNNLVFPENVLDSFSTDFYIVRIDKNFYGNVDGEEGIPGKLRNRHFIMTTCDRRNGFPISPQTIAHEMWEIVNLNAWPTPKKNKLIRARILDEVVSYGIQCRDRREDLWKKRQLEYARLDVNLKDTSSSETIKALNKEICGLYKESMPNDMEYSIYSPQELLREYLATKSLKNLDIVIDFFTEAL